MEASMKHLVAAVLVGVAIAGVGLLAEGVFAKPVHQVGVVSVSQARPSAQRAHMLDPIIVTDGD
jgi:ABC-type Fe3+-siderophore transport system permease subunit